MLQAARRGRAGKAFAGATAMAAQAATTCDDDMEVTPVTAGNSID